MADAVAVDPVDEFDELVWEIAAEDVANAVFWAKLELVRDIAASRA